MAMKRYKIDHTEMFQTELLLEVDHERLTPELASEINNFWSGCEDRLSDADGDPVLAVIKLAASIFLGYVLDVGQCLNTEGMQLAFDNQHEGWPRNGEAGITLIDWDGRPDLDTCLLDVMEVD